MMKKFLFFVVFLILAINIVGVTAQEVNVEDKIILEDFYKLYKVDSIKTKTFISALNSTNNTDNLYYFKSGTPIMVKLCNIWGRLSSDTQTNIITILQQNHESLDEQYETSHFRIHYTTSGRNSVDTTDSDNDNIPDYIENLANYLEYSWSYEVNTMGFDEPADDFIDVYVLDIGAYGTTCWGPLPGGFCSCSGEIEIEIDNSLNDDLLKVTAAHEFFHAVQTGDLYGMWCSEGDWLMEGTATWCEDEVYDSVDDYVNYVNSLRGILHSPDFTSITQRDYDTVIFWKYLSERYGISIIRSVMEHTRSQDGIPAVNSALQGIGTNFKDTFIDFSVANYFNDYMYEEGDKYDDVTTIDITFTGKELKIDKDDGKGESLSTDEADVNPWGIDYHVITLSDADRALNITFNGENPPNHDFAVKVLGIDDSKYEEYGEIDLNSNNDGQITVNTEEYDRLVIIVIGQNYGGDYEITLNEGKKYLKIISPTTESPANAGKYDNPRNIDVTVEVKEDNTPITNLESDDFEITIGGKKAGVWIKDRPIPGRYVLEVSPPKQDKAGKYDLEVRVSYKGEILADAENDSVWYTAGYADVMLIIDRSGSMNWPATKIRDAKNAAKLFVDYMRDGDKAGVVSFSSYARYDYHLTTLTPEVKTAIKNKIGQISAWGMTAMGRGLRYGLNDLVNYGDPTHSWAMVMMSDGYHNTGEHPNNVLPAIKSQNIRVYTIGLGPSVDKDLLEHIATETGGKYYYSPTSAQLQEIYNDIVGKIIGWTTVAKRVFTILLHQIVSLIVPVDPYTTIVTFGISWTGSDVDLVLYRPDGSIVNQSVAATDPDIEYVEGSTYAFYRINNPMPGNWRMEIIGTDVPPEGEEVTATVRASSTLSMSLTTDKDQYNQGEAVKITASLTANGSAITGASVSANITLPDNSVETLILYDDGGHGDGAADDGVYANYFFNTLQVGDYDVVAEARGTAGGYNFVRQETTTFEVVAGPSLIDITPDEWNETAEVGETIVKTFTVSDPPVAGEMFPVNEYLYAEYNGTHYLVYNESSIGGEPDYIISSNPGPNPQVSKWVSLTATSLQTPAGDTIDASNIQIEPNPIEVPLGGSKQFNVTINIPHNTKAGTYSGRIVATAITGSDSINITLTVINEPPIANANGPYTGIEGQTVEFNASASYDPEGMPLTYYWEFGDGETAVTTQPTTSHVYAQEGNYTVTLIVNDSVQNSTPSITYALINDTEPIAEFTANQTSGFAPLRVQFNDSSVSYDGITGWEWDFNGDGSIDSNEQNPTHTYDEAGTYTVLLTVHESDGDSDTETREDYITVTSAADTEPPTIESVTLDTYINIPNSSFHVTVEATDNVGVTSVTADGVALVETGSIWEGNITAPSTTGEYTLTIRAEDAAGNYNETTVDYSVVKPSGSIGIGVDPRLTTVNENDTAVINIKLVSTENFDDIAYVYLTTEGVYPGYEANLTWFNWTSRYVKVPGGATVKVPLEVNIPVGESGYKVFYAKLESTKWTPTAMDTGILYI